MYAKLLNCNRKHVKYFFSSCVTIKRIPKIKLMLMQDSSTVYYVLDFLYTIVLKIALF